MAAGPRELIAEDDNTYDANAMAGWVQGLGRSPVAL